jgi:hypothetical protein
LFYLSLPGFLPHPSQWIFRRFSLLYRGSKWALEAFARCSSWSLNVPQLFIMSKERPILRFLLGSLCWFCKTYIDSTKT